MRALAVCCYRATPRSACRLPCREPICSAHSSPTRTVVGHRWCGGGRLGRPSAAAGRKVCAEDTIASWGAGQQGAQWQPTARKTIMVDRFHRSSCCGGGRKPGARKSPECSGSAASGPSSVPTGGPVVSSMKHTAPAESQTFNAGDRVTLPFAAPRPLHFPVRTHGHSELGRHLVLRKQEPFAQDNKPGADFPMQLMSRHWQVGRPEGGGPVPRHGRFPFEPAPLSHRWCNNASYIRCEERPRCLLASRSLPLLRDSFSGLPHRREEIVRRNLAVCEGADAQSDIAVRPRPSVRQIVQMTGRDSEQLRHVRRPHPAAPDPVQERHADRTFSSWLTGFVIDESLSRSHIRRQGMWGPTSFLSRWGHGCDGRPP